MSDILVEIKNAIIGGAPVTEAYARQIGADGFSPNAARAVDVAKGLIKKIDQFKPGLGNGRR